MAQWLAVAPIDTPCTPYQQSTATACAVSHLCTHFATPFHHKLMSLARLPYVVASDMAAMRAKQTDITDYLHTMHATPFYQKPLSLARPVS